MGAARERLVPVPPLEPSDRELRRARTPLDLALLRGKQAREALRRFGDNVSAVPTFAVGDPVFGALGAVEVFWRRSRRRRLSTQAVDALAAFLETLETPPLERIDVQALQRRALRLSELLDRRMPDYQGSGLTVRMLLQALTPVLVEVRKERARGASPGTDQRSGDGSIQSTP